MWFKTNILVVSLLLCGFVSIAAQEKFSEKNGKNSKDSEKKPAKKFDPKIGFTTGIQVAESAILVYSGLRGRSGLTQIRKTTVEVGRLKITNPDGTISNSKYEQRILRAENLEKERIRINQKLPDAEYSMVYDGKKIFGLYNNSVFIPREDALRSFRNRVWRGIGALLRYSENGSTVKLEKRETIMNVEFYVVSMTDKQKRTTVFYVSKKSLRVLIVKYEEDGIKYRRKFYDHNYAQGTLVPYRTVLWANDKIVEEKNILTITYGQTISENIFKADAP